MKKYEPKKRPTFKMPGGENPKKNLIYGLLMLLVLFFLVILLARSGSLGGESLAEYRKNQIQEEQSKEE